MTPPPPPIGTFGTSCHFWPKKVEFKARNNGHQHFTLSLGLPDPHPSCLERSSKFYQIFRPLPLSRQWQVYLFKCIPVSNHSIFHVVWDFHVLLWEVQLVGVNVIPRKHSRLEKEWAHDLQRFWNSHFFILVLLTLRAFSSVHAFPLSGVGRNSNLKKQFGLGFESFDIEANGFLFVLQWRVSRP